MISNSGGVTNVSESFEELRLRLREKLLIQDLKAALNENVGSDKLFLY